MKKILALFLCLMMLFSSFAMATEENSLVYDEELIASLGLEGEFLALEDFGLMFYCPTDLLMYEVSEEDAAAGTYALFATEDGSFALTVGYGAVADAAGNPVTDHESLVALYTENGISDAVTGDVNGLTCTTYSLAEAGIMGLVFMLDDGNVLTFNIGPVVDENSLIVAAAILSSIMPLQYAE